MKNPHIIIVSPALANANNGNWQTARRWMQFLRAGHQVDCTTVWDPQAMPAPAMMIALHARRSAPSVDAFARLHPERPLALILTGTDLYRDIQVDAAAQRSLQQATHLVVLQAAGLDQLAPALRCKACVIHQSAPSLAPHARSAQARRFPVMMIGHLREEKQPATFMHAASLVRHPSVRLIHVGAALDPALGALAQGTAAQYPSYRWLGAQPHAGTRQRLRRSALMVIASQMEGGANVIIEAVTSGVPVLASDISGNRGMLGQDYAGYFATGDSAALARLIDRAASDPAYYAQLKAQCEVRATLFTPAREKAAVRQLVDNCLLNSTDANGPLHECSH